jgi:hypothetical protein
LCLAEKTASALVLWVLLRGALPDAESKEPHAAAAASDKIHPALFEWRWVLAVGYGVLVVAAAAPVLSPVRLRST